MRYLICGILSNILNMCIFIYVHLYKLTRDQKSLQNINAADACHIFKRFYVHKQSSATVF